MSIILGMHTSLVNIPKLVDAGYTIVLKGNKS
jgi:hypothetical protein